MTLLTRNYRCRSGEIDLVMKNEDTLVFVEVRYRGRGDYGNGAETVDRRKQQRVIRAARHFLMMHPRFQDKPCRFDVIAVSGPPSNGTIQWIAGAFTA